MRRDYMMYEPEPPQKKPTSRWLIPLVDIWLLIGIFAGYSIHDTGSLVLLCAGAIGLMITHFILASR